MPLKIFEFRRSDNLFQVFKVGNQKYAGHCNGQHSLESDHPDLVAMALLRKHIVDIIRSPPSLKRYPLFDWQRAAIDKHVKANWPSLEEGHSWCNRIGWDAAWLIVEKQNLSLSECDAGCISLPLKKQVAYLQVPLETVDLQRRKDAWVIGDRTFSKKEEAIGFHYSANWDGYDFDEGSAINVVLGMLVSARATEVGFNLGFHREPVSSLATFGQYTFRTAFEFFHLFRKSFLNAPEASPERRLADEITEYLCSAPLEQFDSPEKVSNAILQLDELVDQKSPYFDPRALAAGHFLPRVNFMVSLLQGADKGFFSRLTKLYLRYGYVDGWPDLTFSGPEGLGFCEVKEADKLHKSQIAWWSCFAPDLNQKAWIARVSSRKVE